MITVNTYNSLQTEIRISREAPPCHDDGFAGRRQDPSTTAASLDAILMALRTIRHSTGLSDVLRDMKERNYTESYLQVSLRLNIELNNRLNVAETFIEIGLFEHKRGNDKCAAAAFENALKYLGMVCVRNESGSPERTMAAHAAA